MRKSKTTVLSSFIVATLVLGTTFPVAVFANTSGTTSVETKAPVERLYGENRYETAANVALEGWEESEFAILSPGADENLVDALTAAPFAKSLNAPILLTDGSELPSATIEALKELNVKKVYLVSGIIDADKVTQAFEENELEITVEENLGGEDRFETAKNIAAQLENVSGVMVTTAYTYADALSVASIAAAKNMPILLADKDQLPEVEADYLAEIEENITETYVLGGEALIGESVYNELPGEDGETKKRIAGIDRFETNLKVLNEFGDLKYDKVYVANGQDEHLVDALVASSLAAQTNSPIVLADMELNKSAEMYLLENLSQSQVIALGGSPVVTDKVLTYNHLLPQDFAVMQLSGVNGYNVGFEVVGAKGSDIAKAEVALYNGETLLAKNVSYEKLFNEFKDATQFSSPFNIDGNFTADGYWDYGIWNGTIVNVPTKAVITVTYMDGRVYTVENTNLSGDPAELNKEALNHVKVEDFAVMQFSGVNGYNVGFSLVDGKKVYDLKSIEVSLYKTVDNEEEEEVDTLLVTNTATRKTNAKLFELGVNQLSTPFNIDGPFENDGYWTYGEFNGTVSDIPSKAVVTVEYQDGRKFTVQSQNALTGDVSRLGNPTISTTLPEELIVETEKAFDVTTLINNFVVNPDAATTKVRAKVTFTKGDTSKVNLQYKEGEEFKGLTFVDNTTFFGPEAGFPFIDGTSNFKVDFSEAGTYEYKIEIVTVTEDAEDSEVLASYTGEVVVNEKAATETPVE